MTTLLLPKHHSSADWDFRNASWLIDTAQYVSSPSSLKFTGSNTALCKNSVPATIPLGHVEFWFRSQAVSAYPLIIEFRNQAAVGSANRADTYELQRTLDGINSDAVAFWRFEGGIAQWIARLGAITSLPANTWHKFRVSWWESWGQLRMRLERWDGANWVQEGSDQVDPVNKWSDSAINRCGLSSFYGAQWNDDVNTCWP